MYESLVVCEDILQPVLEANWEKLKDLFLVDWPIHANGFHFLLNFIHWKKENIDINVGLYSPRGEWQAGAFVAILEIGKIIIILNTTDGNSNSICEALRHSKLIKWDKGVHFSCVPDNCVVNITNTIQNMGYEIELAVSATFWWRSKEKDLQLNEISPMEDIYVDYLTPDLVDIVDAAWPHSFKGSRDYLLSLIKNKLAIGVFSEKGNSLNSWVFIDFHGNAGIWGADLAKQRKGFGGKVLLEMAKRRAKQGLDLTCFTIDGNTSACKVISSLGFTKLHKALAFDVKPLARSNDL